MKGVTPIIKHNSGCDYHRIINPMTYLGFDINTLPRITTEEILKETKILFFNRTPDQNFDKVIRLKKKHGFRIVLDLDDYWELNVKHPMYSTWKEKKMGEEIIKWIPEAEAITVTTNRLADKVKPLNKNVHVIPNALPFDDGQFNQIRSQSNFTRFVYTGGSSHTWDVAILRNTLRNVNNLPYAQFVLSGYQSSHPKEWGKMDSVFRQAKNYRRDEFRPLASYMNAYRDADVCIIPLESNIFTPYKSNIKFLEAGCKNMPVICSHTPPYSDEPNKDMVKYASNTREWLYWLKYYHNNPNAIIQDGQKLGQYVRANYDLRVVNETRKQLFEYLINN